ncbi:hypothetical protein CEXT_259751 [Caerostris extrusa]|uniref:Transposase n=1 Tax=Caerostris extrusa TaxID=172846 RepID=A0AAV4P133_CAEEX|nr:hypothetical protein CEXT_259751 [Caerostris extrusa]
MADYWLVTSDTSGKAFRQSYQECTNRYAWNHKIFKDWLKTEELKSSSTYKQQRRTQIERSFLRQIFLVQEAVAFKVKEAVKEKCEK